MPLPVADPWFTVETVDDGVSMLTEPHVARLWRANLFLIRGRDRDLLVDTGMGIGPLRATVAALTDRPVTVFTTHSHLDHIGGHFEFADRPIIDLGTRRFEVLHLPGHSPGGIALWDAADGMLIAGDAIYDGILIDTTEDADIPTYLRTMARLRDLPVRIVHGGHKRPFGRVRLHEIVDAYVESRRDFTAPVPQGPGVSF